jgi:acetoin utilization deacetylase AcuC-like enzyme
VLVSAGFDPHRHDPLGGMGVSEAGFGAMADQLLAVADEFAGARIAFLLEGGYDLGGLRSSVAAVLEGMQRGRAAGLEKLSLDRSPIAALIRRIGQIHAISG